MPEHNVRGLLSAVRRRGGEGSPLGAIGRLSGSVAAACHRTGAESDVERDEVITGGGGDGVLDDQEGTEANEGA